MAWCPLTSLAERLGSEHGSVADIYLPPWIEDHLPYVTGPIFAGAVVLHARNILRSREHSTALAKIPAGDAPRNDAEVFVVPGSVARFRSTTQSKGARAEDPGFGTSRYGSTAEIARAIGDGLYIGAVSTSR